MGALSKLDAVNRILRAAGEYPVSTLSVTGSNDVTLAVQVLDETTIHVQLAGLNCNTVETTALPDVNGRITVPDTTISFDTIGQSAGRNLVTRGRSPTYLFDVDDNTAIFEQGVEINIRLIESLSFESLPTPVQFQVTDQAARMYQMSTVGEASQDRLLSEVAMLSRAAGRAEDIRSHDASIFGNKKSPWANIAARRLNNPPF